VPGQKTKVTVTRKKERDLRSLKGGKSMGTIVPVIRLAAR
jgi:hypothetical protein